MRHESMEWETSSGYHNLFHLLLSLVFFLCALFDNYRVVLERRNHVRTANLDDFATFFERGDPYLAQHINWTEQKDNCVDCSVGSLINIAELGLPEGRKTELEIQKLMEAAEFTNLQKFDLSEYGLSLPEFLKFYVPYDTTEEDRHVVVLQSCHGEKGWNEDYLLSRVVDFQLKFTKRFSYDLPNNSKPLFVYGWGTVSRLPEWAKWGLWVQFPGPASSFSRFFYLPDSGALVPPCIMDHWLYFCHSF